ncbi:MAG: hypothetical protein IIC67_01330 [Thaumarchaeota archaeon]|nr:hypothetical protein [Nitrososphaerota archaeon]
MSVFDISEEFFEEERLDRTVHPQKNGGPYTKSDRKKRRDEVFRLHFEHSISAVKIAEMMNIHRHTISKDIEFWNDRLREEWKKADISSWTMKTIHRLEMQRTRLHKELEEQTNSQDRKAWEKLIMEIESKIIQTVSSFSVTEERIRRLCGDAINHFFKENNIPRRFIGANELQVSKEARKKIDKIIEEDKKNIGYWEFDDIEDEEEI